MKDSYKELRKKLKDHFTAPNNGKNYEIGGSVGMWVKQCGINPTAKHTIIICTIFGSVPYPYQSYDRKLILMFLKDNKYKDYKKLQKAKAKKHIKEAKKHSNHLKTLSKKAKKEGRLSI